MVQTRRTREKESQNDVKWNGTSIPIPLRVTVETLREELKKRNEPDSGSRRKLVSRLAEAIMADAGREQIPHDQKSKSQKRKEPDTAKRRSPRLVQLDEAKPGKIKKSNNTRTPKRSFAKSPQKSPTKLTPPKKVTKKPTKKQSPRLHPPAKKESPKKQPPKKQSLKSPKNKSPKTPIKTQPPRKSPRLSAKTEPPSKKEVHKQALTKRTSPRLSKKRKLASDVATQEVARKSPHKKSPRAKQLKLEKKEKEYSDVDVDSQEGRKVRFGVSEMQTIEARNKSTKGSSTYEVVSSNDNVYKLFTISKETTSKHVYSVNELKHVPGHNFAEVRREERVTKRRGIVLISREDKGVDADVFDDRIECLKLLGIENGDTIDGDVSESFIVFLQTTRANVVFAAQSSFLYKIPNEFADLPPPPIAPALVESDEEEEETVHYLENPKTGMFWELTLDGLTHHCRSGKKGSKGKTSSNTFLARNEAIYKADLAIAKRERDGYLNKQQLKRHRQRRKKEKRERQKRFEFHDESSEADEEEDEEEEDEEMDVVPRKKKKRHKSLKSSHNSSSSSSSSRRSSSSSSKSSKHGQPQRLELPASTSTKYLEKRDNFWEISLRGNYVEVRTGKIGSSGTTKLIPCKSRGDARKKHRELQGKQQQKGYCSWALSMS